MAAYLMEHVSCRPGGIMEYWNSDFKKELPHLVTSLTRKNYQISALLHFGRTIIPGFHYSIILPPIGGMNDLLVKGNFINRSLFPRVVYPLFHHSNIPIFQIVSEAN
jgi:hypothetical protein